MQKFLLQLVENDLIVFPIVYLLFLLDNVLLTVVVPIIPDYLFSNEFNMSRTDNRFGPASLSPLQRKFEHLEDENGPLGALLASKAFVQLAFTPLIGYLVGILGCYVPLLVGSGNMLLASILFACGSTYGVLVLARALHGSASAAIAVSGMSLLAKKLPPNLRVKLMPIAFGGIAMGVLIGYPLGGAVYQMLGKSAPFIFISFFILISMLLQIVYLREEEIQEEENNTNYQDCVDLLKDKKTIIVVVTICVSTSTMAVLEPCVPMWLLARLDPPPSRWQLGAVFIPDSVGYFIGSHFAGLLPMVPWRTSIISMVIIGLSCYALPLANTMSQLSLPHFGIGLGVGAVDAALVPLLASFVDYRGGNQYGPIYALQQASVSISYSFGPLLGGQAVHVIGFPWLIRIVGFFNLLVSPLLLELEEKPETMPFMTESASTYTEWNKISNGN
ncbi:chromaffin granule amine transporter-like [Diabrotica undecimpunctata]|uniref:chromaffin granule amine transporter-like n=1 Tax=Diabrotica undecimpunctata TaxID=50387 RepID=UPI003B63BE7E